MPFTCPPHAVPTWADSRNLYLEIPGPDGPVTLSFPLDSGLTKALPYLRKFQEKAPRPVVVAVKAPANAKALEVLKLLRMVG